MMLDRRRFLHLAAGTVAVPAVPRAAHALDYPTRPVHIVAGFPPGSGPDVIGRLAGQWLMDRLKQNFVLDNRPGAASNIGTEIAAKAAPDGYTLLMTVSTNAVNATLYQNLNYNFSRDLVPVANIGATPFVITANPAFPAKTVPEFLAYAKQNPGKINYATSGVGSGPHVSAELLKMMTGVDLVHVPYRNNYVTDLLANQIPLSVSPMPQVIEFIKDGRLKAIAVTPAKRWDALPDVPALGEFVPGYSSAGWYGLTAPVGTAPEIVAKLNAEMNAGLADANLKARLLALGVEPKAMSTAEFGTFMGDEVAKWAKVIKFAALKPAG